MDLCAAGVYTQQGKPHVAQLEASSDDEMFVILSDVHLDRPEVMAQLRKLFEGFCHVCPPLFVFIGNFTSRPLGYVSALGRACVLHELVCEFLPERPLHGHPHTLSTCSDFLSVALLWAGMKAASAGT